MLSKNLNRVFAYFILLAKPDQLILVNALLLSIKNHLKCFKKCETWSTDCIVEKWIFLLLKNIVVPEAQLFVAKKQISLQ